LATERTRATSWATPKGDERRGAILEALGDLLRDRPLNDISVRDLSERAGVSRSTYYFYFPSKSAAVMALLAELQEHVFTLAQSWYDGGPGPPRQRLRDGLAAAVESWRRNPAWTTAILDAVATDPDGGAIWQTYVDGYINRVADRIAADAPPGERPQPHELAVGLVTMLFAMMERDVRAIQATGEPLTDLVDTITFIWHASIYGEG
jgi:AcrR family transcriptional regulator